MGVGLGATSASRRVVSHRPQSAVSSHSALPCSEQFKQTSSIIVEPAGFASGAGHTGVGRSRVREKIIPCL